MALWHGLLGLAHQGRVDLVRTNTGTQHFKPTVYAFGLVASLKYQACSRLDKDDDRNEHQDIDKGIGRW